MISEFTKAKWFVFDLIGPFRWFKTKEEALKFINNDPSFKLLEIQNHDRARKERQDSTHLHDPKRSCQGIRDIERIS